MDTEHPDQRVQDREDQSSDIGRTEICQRSLQDRVDHIGDCSERCIHDDDTDDQEQEYVDDRRNDCRKLLRDESRNALRHLDREVLLDTEGIDRFRDDRNDQSQEQVRRTEFCERISAAVFRERQDHEVADECDDDCRDRVDLILSCEFVSRRDQ